MCGRFSLKQGDVKKIAQRFKVEHQPNIPEITSRYKILPTTPSPTVLMDAQQRHIRMLKWFLLNRQGVKRINVRGETVRVAYKKPFEGSRCLIPADGFVEPHQGKDNQPYHFVLKSREVFAIAGVYDENGFAMVTINPNDVVAPVHSRMPVILHEKDEEAWLTGSPADAEQLILPYDGEMETWPISRKSPNANDPSILDPIEEERLLF